MLQRFRFTLLALCLLLLFLGGHDLLTHWGNLEPHRVSIDDLDEQELPGEWLTIEGGVLDLTEAINMSGSIELDAFLVPLKSDRSATQPRVIVETRDPRIIETLTHYYFKLDSTAAQQSYLAENQAQFYLRRPVTGMPAGGLVASANRDKLIDLARQLGMQVPEQVIFLSEGKTPATWRGYLFSLIGLAGIIQILRSRRSPTRT